jgi:hypothetical protein
VAVKIRNDYSFPAACTIRFKFAAKGSRPALDLFWYDGSMKPPTPEELEAQNQELDAEGLMFVGDKGKILADFLGNNSRIISGQKSVSEPAADAARNRDRRSGAAAWVAAAKGGPPTYGDFLLAGPISDAFNLAAVSLRMGGRRLLFDATAGAVKNIAEANKLLTREYRQGWAL